MIVSIQQQVACAERELRLRERAYPRWIQLGKITAARADHELEAMKAIVETLKGLVPPPPPNPQKELL